MPMLFSTKSKILMAGLPAHPKARMIRIAGRDGGADRRKRVIFELL
jgi:hypothetical protein